MEARIPCPQCGGLANQRHHKFPQTVDNIEAYGKKLMCYDFQRGPHKSIRYKRFESRRDVFHPNCGLVLFCGQRTDEFTAFVGHHRAVFENFAGRRRTHLDRNRRHARHGAGFCFKNGGNV